MIENTSPEILFQLGDIYSVCRRCWNVATYKWKVNNWKCNHGNDLYLESRRQKRSVGHVSLKVDNSSTYISWYPLDNKTTLRQKATLKEALPSSYEEDCSNFTKRPADEIFKIQPDLVIASKIDDWWSHNKVSEQYHILVRNCATIVCDALDVGARDPDGFAVLQALSLKGSITPMDIRYFCANMGKITFQNFDIFNGLLSVLLCIGFVTVVFIKLFYGSNKWYQLISTCLRIILVITCLLRYLEVLLALCSTSTLVLIFSIVVSLIYMFINHVYNSFIIIDLLSSDNDTAVSWINSTENRTFIVFWTVLFSTNFFNSSPFKIISFYLTFYGLQFATQSFFTRIMILLFCCFLAF